MVSRSAARKLPPPPSATTKCVDGARSATFCSPLCKSRLGAGVMLVATSMPSVAAPITRADTCAGVAAGTRCRYSATTPVVCAADSALPLVVADALSPADEADKILAPGA